MRYDEKSLFPKSILEMEAKMKATHAMRMSMGNRRRESVLKGSRMQVGSVSRRPSHWNKMLMKRGKNDVE